MSTILGVVKLGSVSSAQTARVAKQSQLSKAFYAPSLNGNPTIIGVSSSDKSVRLYSEYGSLIARDWGHTEGITDFALLPPKMTGDEKEDCRPQLVTVAADSTIFMWDTVSNTPKLPLHEREVSGGDDTPTATKQATPMGPPLRKMISFSELSNFKTAEVHWRRGAGIGGQYTNTRSNRHHHVLRRRLPKCP